MESENSGLSKPTNTGVDEADEMVSNLPDRAYEYPYERSDAGGAD